MVKLAERISRQNNKSGISGMVTQFNRSLNTLSVCFGHCLNALDQPVGPQRPEISRSRFAINSRIGRG